MCQALGVSEKDPILSSILKQIEYFATNSTRSITRYNRMLNVDALLVEVLADTFERVFERHEHKAFAVSGSYPVE